MTVELAARAADGFVSRPQGAPVLSLSFPPTPPASRWSWRWPKDYAGRIRQKDTRAERAAGRVGYADRTAPARRGHFKGAGHTYWTTLESLISVASRAAEIFERSKTAQKRQLIAFVFSNLRLKGKKLEFALRSPFDLMVNRPNYASWLGD